MNARNCHLLILFAVILCSFQLSAQSKKFTGTHVTIMLANGYTASGTIISHTTGKSITIRQDVGGVATFNVDEILSIKRSEPGRGTLNRNQNNQYPPNYQPVVSRKEPALSFLLSFLIVGGGQLYNGQHEKGAIMFFGALFGGALALSTRDQSEGAADFGVILWSVSVIWSLIDAPTAASEINRKNGYAHLFQRGKMGLDLAYDNRALKTNFTFHF